MINLLMIFGAEPLVKLIGLHYKTNERVAINITIFMCLLLNSMILPILLQANFSKDYPGSIWDSIFSAGGRNSDFGDTWYTDICSQLTLTLFLLALMPVVLVIIEATQLKLMRL
jgi:hypothetical protein